MSKKIYPDIDIDLTDFDKVNIYDKDYSDCHNVTVYATKEDSVQLCFTFHLPHGKHNLREFQDTKCMFCKHGKFESKFGEKNVEET